MFDTKIKRITVATVILFVAVIISGVVLQKTDAQVDAEVCQKEYNASRSKCITDNTACVADCGGNQTCELDCNTVKRNACDDAAVARQKECLGVDNYTSDMPVSNIQPDAAIDCQSAYDRDRATCQNTANACYNSCEKGLSDNYWTCMEACTSRITDCGKEARNKFSACDSGSQPPAAKPPEQPPAQITPPTENDVDTGEEIIIDETSYTIALVDASTKNDFDKMVSAVTHSGREVSITLESKSPAAPVNDFMLNTSNLWRVQPTIIFNDDTKDKFSIDVGKLVKSYLEVSDTDTLEAEKDSLLQKKILDIMQKNPPAKTATFSTPETSIEPFVIFSPLESLTESILSPPTYSGNETISAGTFFLASPGSLVVLDSDAADLNAPMTTSGSAVTSQAQDSDKKAMNGADVVFEVKTGKTIVVAGWSAEDTLTATSDFVSALDTVEVRHHKTAYGMAIDPESGKKIIEIYDGEIELFDRKTGAALATLATEFGKSIKRVEIDKDGVVKQQIAISQSEWPAFVASQQKNRPNAWVWILVILVVGGIGYFAYRKKDELMKIIKKEPKQSP